MKIILIITFLILVVALQLTILPRLKILGAMPNFFLALVIALAIGQREENFKWWLFGAILAFDALAGRPFGFLTLALWLTFYLLGWLAKSFFRQTGFLATGALVAIGVLIFELLFIGLIKTAEALGLAAAKIEFFDFYLVSVLPANLLFNTMFALLIFYIFKKLYLRWTT